MGMCAPRNTAHSAAVCARAASRRSLCRPAQPDAAASGVQEIVPQRIDAVKLVLAAVAAGAGEATGSGESLPASLQYIRHCQPGNGEISPCAVPLRPLAACHCTSSSRPLRVAPPAPVVTAAASGSWKLLSDSACSLTVYGG